MILDLFAGPGGWDEGLRAAGYAGELLGFDFSEDACATARAAGHDRELVDLVDHPFEQWAGRGVDGLVGSPSCVADFVAGKREGLGSAIGRLSLLPCRWALALRPRWVALEQVRGALPVYRATAATLERVGYSTWCGLVNANDYGVPSDRTRAIMLARLDEPVAVPAPTTPGGVTMRDVLGPDFAEAVLVSNYGTGGDPRKRGRRTTDRPAFTMTGKCGRNRWEWPDGTTRNVTVAEAAVLQGFRADYPWQGGATSRQQQVGDAVPPPLAAALVAPLLASATIVQEAA